MSEIRFGNPIFHNGINTTFRDGKKWAFRLEPGEKILLAGLRNEPKLTATVKFLHISQYQDAPKRLFELEHDPACGTLQGLRDVMQDLYPGFKDDNIVTVIGFVPDGEEGYYFKFE